MKKNSQQSKSSHSGTGMAVGASILTAAALAGAAAYLLSGKEGEKRRAKMKTWAIQARKEVAQKVKMAREMGEEQYKNIVDEAVKRYGTLEKVNVQELMKVAKDMKGDWEKFQQHAKTMQKMVSKKAQIAKKAVKKSSKAKKK